MDKYYSVCDKIIRFRLPEFYDKCPQWRLYETEAKEPDIDYEFEICQSVPAFYEHILSRKNDSAEGIYNGRLFRTFYDGSKPITTCILGQSNTHTVFVDKNNLEYALDNKRFFLSFMVYNALLSFGILNFHSSFIQMQGKGIIFSGVSGAGKSTQAGLWVKHRGARIINGDKSCIALVNGEPRVYSLPVCGLSNINSNESYPLEAVLFPIKSDRNEAVRLNPGKAFEYALPHIFYDSFSSDIQIKVIQALSDIAAKVPFYALYCTLDKEATQVIL